MLLLFLLLAASAWGQTVINGASLKGTVALGSPASGPYLGITAVGPLVQSSSNSRYFQDTNGKTKFLAGVHTWTDLQDISTSPTPAALDSQWTIYATMLQSTGANLTQLWHKDMPVAFNWGAGGTWYIDHTTGQAWVRNGCTSPGVSGSATANDGKLKWDLSQFNSAFFTRYRNRIIQLGQAGIYVNVMMTDGFQEVNNRGTGDGYPLTSANNCNGISDGYSGSGALGPAFYAATTNSALTDVVDTYIKRLIDQLNDLPNIIWMPQEEMYCGNANPGACGTTAPWWATHIIGLIRTYEAGGTWEGVTYPGKPLKHPVVFDSIQTDPFYSFGINTDPMLYASSAEAVSPITSNGTFSGSNNGKVVILNTDHSYATNRGIVSNTDLQTRQMVWESVINGANFLFMDPGFIQWTSLSRNINIGTVTNGVGSSLQTSNAGKNQWSDIRNNAGYTVAWVNKLNLARATPQGSLSNTGFAMAQTPAIGAEYLIYSPSTSGGSTFTVNLSNASGRTFRCEWLSPSTGAATTGCTGIAGSTVAGGSAAQSLTVPGSFPASNDAVAYVVDTAGHL